MKGFIEVTHRHITAEHYQEDGKYMIWYHLEGNPFKTIGMIQVRGIKKPLTEDELKTHIDKLLEESHKQNHKQKKEV